MKHRADLRAADRPTARRRFAWAIAAVAAVLALIAAVAFRWADRHARVATDQAAMQQARTSATLLASELQKFRLLPLVLAQYPDARALLANPVGAARQATNQNLELLAERTDAAAIYLIQPNGLTIAASNWNRPSTFVGQNYAFRPYFREAMAKGSAELYALGTVSGRPGLFIARRIDSGARPLGVVVVKVEFDRIERAWARQDSPTFVADDHGVIIITSRPAWRFHTIRPISPAVRREIRQSVQFGGMPLDPLALRRRDGSVETDGVRYRAVSVPVAMPGAALHLFQPLGPEAASANNVARSAVLLGFILCAGLLGWLFRAGEKKRIEAETRRMLESEVAARTLELERTSRSYREAREELAQASRLGSIGQITAGVAHEVNQPVAAIRGFADNAATFLDRGAIAEARANLTHIAALTERIGTITAELRSFARRSTPTLGPTDLGSAIDGALLLVGDRLRETGVRLVRDGPPAGTLVRADRVRLEQILINLFQNAFDALRDAADPTITVTVTVAGETARLWFGDNGRGIDPEVEDNLFTPFVTSKSDGLGLGLGIARDIAREFGGSLDPDAQDGPGARFLLTLQIAR